MNTRRLVIPAVLLCTTLLHAAGVISTIAGNGVYGFSGDGGPALNASMYMPNGVAVDAAGNIYIADQYNYRVRKVALDGTISTFVGNGLNGYSGDGGPASSASLSYLLALAIDSNGNLYVADQNNYVRKVNISTGIITTLAGNGTFGRSGDGGPATSAALYRPNGLAVDASGNVYISEYYGMDVRRVDAVSGIITTIAGNGTYGASGDGGPAVNAQISNPEGLAISNGFLYVTQSTCVIRRVDLSSGIISAFAGNGFCSDSGDGLPASQASLNIPFAIAADASGGIYVLGYNDERVRYINPAGIVSTVVGTGAYGFSGDGGDPALATIWFPLAVTVDGSNRLLIADANNERIRRVSWVTPTSVTLAASPNPSTPGQSVAFTATVTPAAANGTVEFHDGTTVLGTSPVTGGIASFATTALSPGSHSLTAVYLRDAVYDTSTSSAVAQTVQPASPTTTTLASSQNPLLVGNSVTFTATVSPSTATGTVQFLDGGTVVSSGILSGGSAAFSTSSLALGPHSMTAVYSGDTQNAGSTSAVLSQAVQQAAGLTMTLTPTAVLAGQPVTITAQVNAAATGTVKFTDGSTLLSTVPVAAGVASYSATFTAGLHLITVTYSGDNFYQSSSSGVNQQVLAVSSVALVTSLSPSASGQSVTFTATVTPSAATGTVQFLDAGAVIGTSPVAAGTASFSTTTLASGSHSITAVYSGDTNNATATSSPLTQIVLVSTSVSLASNLNPAVVGQTVTFTASVTPSAATGTIQFLDGTTVLTTVPVTLGAAVYTTSSLAQGAHSMSAVYSGDATYQRGASVAISETVNAKTDTTTLLASSSNPSVGGTVTFTASVTPATATGTVQFLDGATVLSTGTLAGGTAQFSTSTLSPGTHPITAVYSGDATNQGSTSAVLSEAIKQSPGLTIGLLPSPAVADQVVTLSAHINAAATGTVTFTDGNAVLATLPVSGGVATYTTSSLAPGVHSLGVSYSGDATFVPISGSANETVLVATSLQLLSNADPVLVGQSITFRAVFTPTNVTGTVQFYDGQTLIGTVPVSSVTQFSTSSLAAGLHSITASYSGDSADAPAYSNAVTEHVRNLSSIMLTSSANPSVVGQSVTLSATIAPSTATGSVQFIDGATVLASVALSAGHAAFATSQLAPGAHSLTALYTGDNADTAVTSAVFTQTVNVPAPGAPSNLTAAAAGSSQINLAWAASATSGVTYNVYASTSSGFAPSPANRIASGLSAVAYSVTGLAPSTTYYYRVTAANAGGESAATNQAAAQTTASVSCKVTYSVTSQWNVGFGTNISIKNTGSTPINSWTLMWTWAGNQVITQSWNANYTQNGQHATLTSMSYNQKINPNASATGIGFNASYSGTNPAPTAFYVNGSLCQ
jgi:sugar lactone lactonase YvrE